MANPIIKTFAELSGENNLFWGTDLINFKGVSNYNVSRIGNLVNHSQNIYCEDGYLGEKLNDEALIVESLYVVADASMFPISTGNVYNNLNLNLNAVTIPGTNNIVITLSEKGNSRKTKYEDFKNLKNLNLSFNLAYMAI